MVRFADDDPGDEEPPLEDDDFDLDEEFPLGDGTAETTATVTCPYCAEEVEIGFDPGSGSVQDYVEDCQVCCQPWRVIVRYNGDGTADVHAEAADGDSPPWEVRNPRTHSAPSDCSMSWLATRRESVSFQRPERSVTSAGLMRVTLFVAQAAGPTRVRPSAARASARGRRRTARARGMAVMVGIGDAGCGGGTHRAHHGKL